MYTIDIWNQHAAGVNDIKRKTKAFELRSEILIEFPKGKSTPPSSLTLLYRYLKAGTHGACYYFVLNTALQTL